MTSPDRLPSPPGPLPVDPEPHSLPAGVLRCQRCRTVAFPGGLEKYLLDLGLCYWCAHVDSQG